MVELLFPRDLILSGMPAIQANGMSTVETMMKKENKTSMNMEYWMSMMILFILINLGSPYLNSNDAGMNGN